MQRLSLNRRPYRISLLASATVFVWMGCAQAQSASLDMDVDTPAPAAPASPAPAAHASLEPVTRAQSANPKPIQPVAEAVRLDHPSILNTASLQSGAVTINLFGIEGLSGEAVQGLQSFLASTNGQLTCKQADAAHSVCLLSDGTDLAQVALVNGAARTTPDAPEPYKEQEAAAQAARRGIWINLPSPPETLTHPSVPNTATLAVSGKTFPLDGLQGFGQPYASQLQSYIAANGDTLSCSPQGETDNYICLLTDGTDIAKVALVNGAARVAPDAPDSYRQQQAEALKNHRGFWLNAPANVMATALTPPPDAYAFVAGDDGADGITYVGGAPTAVIDGAPVFLVYGDNAGWGYYDHWRHWRGAPDHFRDHMEHYHPYGHGLRGYRHDDAFGHEGGFRHGEAFRHDEAFRREGGFRHEEAMHHDAGFPHGEAMRHEAGFPHGEAMRHEAGFPHGEAMRHDANFPHGEAMRHEAGFPHAEAMRHEAAPNPGFARPGMTAGLPGHPEAPHPGFVHPNAMASAGGFHPGMPAGGGFHPAPPAGGGFHPNALAAGGFHPGAPAAVIHPVAQAAPAMHAAPAPAPAKHH